MTPTYGIDVSHHQGTINWEAALTSGRTFAIMKASEGTGFTDKRFEYNWQASERAGWIRGAYHYFRPGGEQYNVDPVKQAKHFKSVVGDLEQGDLIPWLDVEDDAPYYQSPVKIPANQIIAELHACLEAMDDLFGVQCGIYTGAWFWNTLHAGDQFADRLLWCAHYFTDRKPWPPSLPNGWTDYEIHQYTSRGTVPGISGNVDWNYAPKGVTYLLAGQGDDTTNDGRVYIEQIRTLLDKLETVL